MKRKSILALIIIVSISLVGCGNNSSKTNIGNESDNKVVEDNTTKEELKKSTDAIKDNIETAGDSLKYTAVNFKDDVINAGYELKDSINNTKKYFTGNETDYLMGSDIVRVYEYNSTADLEGDINRIAPNGLTINGTDANYKSKPYYYKKGNSLIVYEGNEPAYIDEFNTMYGNALRP